VRAPRSSPPDSRRHPGEHEAIVAALSDPALHPERPDEVEVHETHISWVFVAGRRALKLKKPVVLPFVDYGTAARRRAMCEAEVTLNRQLAPTVYLGVRSLVPSDGSYALGDPDEPGAVEHVVEMRRFAEDRTLAALVTGGGPERGDLERIGARLAAFHAAAPSPRRGAEEVERLRRRLAADVGEALGLAGPAMRRRLGRLDRFARAFLRAREANLCERARRGRVREGHGDLRAEHVLVEPAISVVDCVEFDRGLREADAGDDLAFLLMDLERLGAPGTAAAIIAAYRAAGGDPGDDALVAFFAMRRAIVRAKVALVRQGQRAPGDEIREAAHAEAGGLLDLAERLAWRARLPLVLVVCGVPASGKSTLAERIAGEAGLAHLSSDAVRKGLAGLAPTERAGPEHYTPAFGRRTYRELGRLAAQESRSRGGAVVDATFRHRADRDAFADGLEAVAPAPVFLECRAPAAVLAARARRRLADPGRVSDADESVAARLRHDFEPLDEVPPERHLTVRADAPLDACLEELWALLDLRLER
jgi:uncharacterized protein